MSLRARASLAASRAVLHQSLADGPGIARALMVAGIEPVTPFGRFVAAHWSQPGPLCGEDLVLVAGVPPEAVEYVYQRLVGPDAYNRERRANEAQIAVNFDWADLTLPPLSSASVPSSTNPVETD